jgi:hypothetical protein
MHNRNHAWKIGARGAIIGGLGIFAAGAGLGWYGHKKYVEHREQVEHDLDAERLNEDTSVKPVGAEYYALPIQRSAGQGYNRTDAELLARRLRQYDPEVE